MKLGTVRSNLQCFSSEFNQTKWLCWIPLSCGRMPYGKGFVNTDDVDWWLLRFSVSFVFLLVSLAVPVFIFIVFPKSLWAYGFALRGGCGRQGTSEEYPRVSYRDMDLGVYNGCCFLVAGKHCPQQSLCFVFPFFLGNNSHLLLSVDQGG